MNTSNFQTNNLPEIPENKPILTNQYLTIKQCKHGLVLYNRNDLFVGRSMELYGEWCEAELHALGQLIHPGDVIIDVGANIGSHTLFFAQKVAPQGFVYAIEPQRLTFEILCSNIALNALLNVIPHQVAVGDQSGEIIIPVLNPTSQQNFAALNIEGHNDGDIVRIIPLDDLKLKRCNLIKIDVEGMELKVLHGAENTIRSHRPFLFIENNSKDGSPQTVQALFDLGYQCWWHIANYYNEDNYFQNKENIFLQYAPEANMICIPGELNINVSGFEAVKTPDDTWLQAVERMGLIKH